MKTNTAGPLPRPAEAPPFARRSRWVLSRALAPLLAGLVVMWPTGCLNKSRPRKQLFALTAPAVPAPSPVTSRVLEVRDVHIAPLYDEKALVYRLGEQAYESDPYAAFMVEPDRMFGAALRTHLRNTGLFLNVVESGSPVGEGLSLEVEVIELCADFRGEGYGEAVLCMRYLFYQAEHGAPARVLYARDLLRRVPLKRRSPTAVVAGWDQALNDIVETVAAELKPILTANRFEGTGRTMAP